MSGFDPSRDRVAVVSGAGTGIGRAIAAKFGALGWSVAVGGRRPQPLAETVLVVEAAGGRCLAHELDVTDADSIDRFFAAAEAEFGPVNVVVNNAALARYGPLDDFEPGEIETEIATKLTGSLLMARRGIRSMRPRAAGDILFMSSESGGCVWPLHLPYAAANAGVEHAARILSRGLEGSGIRVAALRCGGTVGTDFATREIESGRMLGVNECWFSQGLLRHEGAMTPEQLGAIGAMQLTFEDMGIWALEQEVTLGRSGDGTPSAEGAGGFALPEGVTEKQMEEMRATFESGEGGFAPPEGMSQEEREAMRATAEASGMTRPGGAGGIGAGQLAALAGPLVELLSDLAEG